MRAVIYARYSTDLQSRASIEDQVRLCRARLEGQHWPRNRPVICYHSATELKNLS